MLTIDTHKVCSRCGDIKLHNEFYRHKRAKDGLTFCCKKCWRKKSKDITKVRKYKPCSYCKEIKHLSEFPVWKRNKKTGVREYCKKCRNAYCRSIGRFHQRFIDIPETKTCKKCKVTKPASQFPIQNRTNDRLDSLCKVCKNILRRHYRRNRPQKTCMLCNATKPRILFPTSEDSKDGRLHICKNCFEQYEVNHGDIDALIEKIRDEDDRKKQSETYKTCKICNINKPLSDFHRHTKAKDGHDNRCKKCSDNRRIKTYYAKKHEQISC